MDSIYLLALGFFLIAFLYSSVGFGGGSSYLALLALFFVSISFIRTTALLCNLAVVSGSVVLFYEKGLLDLKKFLPFVIVSIPLAFFGARLRLETALFFFLLAGTLIIAALLLLWRSFNRKKDYDLIEYPNYAGWLIGGLIGFLAGLVGIGGGIFLAPVLYLMKWEKPLKIAALTSFFILVNSISGLIGLYSANNFELDLNQSVMLLLAVIMGGQLGIRSSLRWFNGRIIRIITSVLIFIVAVRVLAEHI